MANTKFIADFSSNSLEPCQTPKRPATNKLPDVYMCTRVVLLMGIVRYGLSPMSSAGVTIERLAVTLTVAEERDGNGPWDWRRTV